MRLSHSERRASELRGYDSGASHVAVRHSCSGLSQRMRTVKITDRGPFVRGRHIDLSPAAARAIGMSQTGNVTLSVVR